MSKLSAGYDHTPAAIDYESTRETKNLSVYPGKEIIVTLLDTAPVRVMRHKLFIKGDKAAKHKRATCAGWNPDTHPQLPKGIASCPRECKTCNGMLVSPAKDFIGRSLCYYLSCINESDSTDINTGRPMFDKVGRPYKDNKRLIELDYKGYQSFQQKAKTYGQLAGMRFRVNRTGPPPGQQTIQSPQYGDIWEPLDVKPVDLVRHFWNSPVVARVQEGNARKSNQVIPHEQVVRELVAPFNYDEEVGTYNAEEHDRFLAYAEGMHARFSGQPQQGQGGGYAPPPPPPGSMPNYAPSAPPAGAMPAGQVPSYQQPQQGAPQGYQPPAPPQSPAGYPGQPPIGGGPPPQQQTPPWQGQPAPGMPSFAPPGAQQQQQQQQAPAGYQPPQQSYQQPQQGMTQGGPPPGYGAPPAGWAPPPQQGGPQPGQPPYAMAGTPRLAPQSPFVGAPTGGPTMPDPAGARQASYAPPPPLGSPAGGFGMPTGQQPMMTPPQGQQGWQQQQAPGAAADDDPMGM